MAIVLKYFKIVVQFIRDVPQFIRDVVHEVRRVPKRNIYEEIFPLIVLLKICFMVQRNIPYQDLRYFRAWHNSFTKLVFVGHIVHDIFLFVKSFTTELDPTNIKILQFCNRSFLTLAALITLFMVAYLQTQKVVWESLEYLNRCDKNLQFFNCSVDHTANSFQLMVFFFVSFGLMCCVYIYDISRRKSKAILYFYMTFCWSGCYMLMVGQYVTLIFQAICRLRKLNQCLKINYLGDEQSSTFDRLKNIRRIEHVYNLIVDSVDATNNGFGVIIMFYIGQCFIFIVLTLFCLLTIINRGYYDELGSVIINLLYCLFYTAYFLITVCLGSLLEHETDKMAEYLHRAVLNNQNEVLEQKLLDFSQLIIHRRPYATCYIFNFDLSLLGSTLASCTIYISILMQFEMD